MKILTVCLGNICRSPLAEGLLRREIEARGLDWTVDSAGTGNWHAGDNPDPRSVAVAGTYGLDISDQRARQLSPDDLDQFDLVLAMDESNFVNIRKVATTDAQRSKIHQIMAYAFPDRPLENVPDPYWDDDGFERVYQMLRLAAAGVVDRALAEQ